VILLEGVQEMYDSKICYFNPSVNSKIYGWL